jgi:hypothetical protein
MSGYRLVQRNIESLLSARLMGPLNDRDAQRLSLLLAEETAFLSFVSEGGRQDRPTEAN